MSAKVPEVVADVSKRLAELFALEAPEHKISVLTLRKVCERALADYASAEYPGRDARPWLEGRCSAFLRAVRGEDKTTPDADLLPVGHPQRKDVARPDPWAELLDAEERIKALQKSLVETITRPGVRKVVDTELVQMNRRLSHLYAVHFGDGEPRAVGAGIERQKVVEAAATVHEELERRGLLAPDEPLPKDVHKRLYEEALLLRAEARVLAYEGELVQVDGGVVLKLAGANLLLPSEAATHLSVAKRATRFSVAGSIAHPPLREPHEVGYEHVLDVPEGVSIGTFTYTKGARTEDFSELFVHGALDGVLVVGKTAVMLRKSLVPYVLTPEAMAAGYMPPDGESALPPSLEWDVPPELRYWRSALGQDPGEVRDQLVAAKLFTDDTVRFVEGVPRRVFAKWFVGEPFPAAPSTFAELQPEARPEFALYKTYMGGDPRAFGNACAAGGHLVSKGALAPHGREQAFYFEMAAAAPLLSTTIDEMARELDKYLVGLPDSDEARAALKQLGSPFMLPGCPGKLFVASHPVDMEVEWLGDTYPVTGKEAADLDKRAICLVKQSASEEEHYVLGVVLEPDVVDAQQDTYSADEVRKSAHRFLAHYRNAGLMHKTLVNDHVRIVESYLAPSDCEIGGQTVKQGTWLMGMVVEDDDLWAQVKSGALTGFSIGGTAIRTEEA